MLSRNHNHLKFFLVLTMAAIICLHGSPSLALTCGPQPISEAYKKLDLIFAGWIVDAKLEPANPALKNMPTQNFSSISLKPAYLWKGTKQPVITIDTKQWHPPFQPDELRTGTPLLIFAKEVKGVQGPKYYVEPCGAIEILSSNLLPLMALEKSHPSQKLHVEEAFVGPSKQLPSFIESTKTFRRN